MDRKTFMQFEQAAKDVELLKIVVESLSHCVERHNKTIAELESKVASYESRKPLSLKK